MKNLISPENLINKLLREERVALFMHVRPDGDTIGSTLALSFALNKKGVKTEVFCADALPSRFLSFKGTKDVKTELFGEYTALVAVDSADVTRLGDFALYFASHKNTYSIDHHVSNPNFAKVNYVKDSAANCENVYELITTAGIEIDSDISNLLALGIVTDTGNFKHKNVTAKTLSIASCLVEKGADLNYIVFKTITEQSKQRAKLFGLVMSKLRFFLEDRLCIATIFDSQIKESGALPDETEGFIDFLTGITGVEVSVCMLETEKNVYKISFRSKKTDVSAVASVFGGGGHVLASGCKIHGEYEEVVDKIYSAVKRFIED